MTFTEAAIQEAIGGKSSQVTTLSHLRPASLIFPQYHDSTPSSPSMTFSEDGLDDSDNEEANYDQVTLGC